MPELSKLEKQVTKIQQILMDRPSKIADSLKLKPLKEYSLLLAKHYFPRSKAEDYLLTAAEAFAVDLATAPYLHTNHHLWKYNFNDLDLLANFYKFSNTTHKYFHLSTGELPPPTPDSVEKGSSLLGINYKKPTLERLFETYNAAGLRSRIAARIIEQLAGVEHDHDQNKLYGFMLDPSKRNLRAAEGLGKYRYLRKGRTWLALGTAAVKDHTKDLRKEDAEVFDYVVSFKDGKVKTAIAEQYIEAFKIEVREILNSDSSILIKLRRAEAAYKNFYNQHRFANTTSWSALDTWLKNQSSKARKRYPKFTFEIFRASTQPRTIIHLPARRNFFWNPAEELHCDFKTIWNPYNWQEP
jgi:hypothetical protein